MKHPINTWSRKDVERIRRIPLAGKNIDFSFTEAEKAAAKAKLEQLYPERGVYPFFAEKILLLQEFD